MIGVDKGTFLNCSLQGLFLYIYEIFYTLLILLLLFQFIMWLIYGFKVNDSMWNSIKFYLWLEEFICILCYASERVFGKILYLYEMFSSC